MADSSNTPRSPEEDPEPSQPAKPRRKKMKVVTAKEATAVSSIVDDPDAPGPSGLVTLQRTPRSDSDDDDSFDEFELKYGASHVIKLFVPVSICMAMVVATMNSINFYSDSGGRHLIYTPFVSNNEDGIGTKALYSLGNAAIMFGVVVIMTFLLILLYRKRCYKIIHGWLFLSSFMLLSFFTTIYVHEVMRFYDISLSIVTVGFLLVNFGVLGMICIHWKGPLILQQFYLITVSALMALVFIKYLPEWTVWTVLAVISIWDLIAVLWKYGPLRMLVETAQERNETIFPALIYSSGVAYPYIVFGVVEGDAPATEGQGEGRENVASGSQTSSQSAQSSQSTHGLLKGHGEGPAPKKVIRIAVPPNNHRVEARDSPQRAYVELRDQPANNNCAEGAERQERQTPSVVEEKGVKLGLGDFIFYSVLVGKASSYFDWNTTVACYVAILVGLCVTLVILAMLKRALPALPISIFAGIIFYFSTRFCITPFVTEITELQLIY